MLYHLSPPRCCPLRFKPTVASVDRTDTRQFTNGNEQPTNQRPAQRRGPRQTGSDIDSDEEIRRMVTAQNTSHAALLQEEEEEYKLEVVGLDYLVKSGRARQQQKGNMF